MKHHLRKPHIQLFLIVGTVVLMIGFMYAKVTKLEAQSGTDTLGVQDSTASSLTIQENDHVRGSKDAEIVIFEFSDLECPFCERVHPTLAQLVEESDGNVAWVFNHFPLSSHPHSQEKAIAAECVAKLGGEDSFWTYIDTIFKKGTSLAVSELNPIAQSIGIDGDEFDLCLSSEETLDIVNADLNLGVVSGVTGTPGNLVVNVTTGASKLVPGALPKNQFEQVIQSLK